MPSRTTSLVAAVTVALPCTIAAGGTVDVGVGPGFDFFPADIEINVGDTVHWFWDGGLHNVVSGPPNGVPDGIFSSGEATLDTSTTFDLTFDQAFLDANPVPGNVYEYFCEVHVPLGMVGTVTVLAGPDCPEDTDDSGAVDVDDLVNVIVDWGTDGSGNGGDVDGSGVVDVDDLVAVVLAWGPC